MRTPLRRSEADAEDFDRCMRAAVQCGRVDYGRLSGPDTEQLLACWDLVQAEVQAVREAIELAQGQGEPPVYVDFFESSVANAVVTPREYGGHWIGVSSGAFRLVSSALGHVFRHRGMLADLGDAAGEVQEGPLTVHAGTLVAPNDPPPVRRWTWTPALAGWLPDAQQGPVDVVTALQPRDPLRRFAYVACLSMFFQYLGLHELGHIQRRHLALLGRRGTRAAFFGESAGSTRPGLQALESQALEQDADAWAAWQMLGKWAHQGNFVKLAPFEAEAGFDINDPLLHLRLWFVTQNVFAWIFGRKGELAQYDGSTHPHPDVRFRLLLAQLYARGGALLSPERQQQLWHAKDLIVADTVNLRAALIAGGAVIDGTRVPNLDDEAYSLALHERVGALGFAGGALEGELAAARGRQPSATPFSDRVGEEIRVRLSAWDDRWRQALRPPPMAPVSAGAGNLEWLIPEFSPGSEAEAGPIVQTGAVLQLSLLCWSLACPGDTAASRWLPGAWRSDLWPALMAVGQQHLLAWADADAQADAVQAVQPWAEAWLEFLGAAFLAAGDLDATAPWSVPRLRATRRMPGATPPWLLVLLHQQMAGWAGRVDAARTDAFSTWLREWQELEVRAGGPGASLAHLLLTAPWRLLSPPDNDFSAGVCDLARQAGLGLFAGANEPVPSARLDTAVQAVTYLAVAARALQPTRRPFIAFANLINRLSLRCCVRVAPWGEPAQALWACPTLDERAQAAIARAHSLGAKELPMDAWLRQWAGDLPDFERRCLAALPAGVGFPAVAAALCHGLGELAAQYRALDDQARATCPVFQAVDAWTQDAGHPMQASALAARGFLQTGTAAALIAYMAAWPDRYEAIERQVVQDGLAQSLAALTGAPREQRARFVWPDAQSAQAALGPGATR